MRHPSKGSQFISIIVSLGLFLQLIMPVFSIGSYRTVQAQPSLPPASVNTPSPREVNSTTAVTNQNQPAVLDPLSLTRGQSTYQADGTAVITYTLRNSLAPTIRPDASPTDTITDTVAAIEATDFAADPNTIRDAQLVLNLTNAQTSLQSATLPVDQDGDWLSINLGDIPPLSAAEVAVTLDIPSSAADFVELDAGANAYGRWRSISVSTAVSPIRVAPDGFDQWLVCTMDANCADSYVIRKASELGNDPVAIFEYVRSLGYESYVGSLRGARGTLWSEAGNGYDQASLLVALLRASGIPAAYRLGSLDQADAQTLLGSMFTAVNAPSGLVPVGADVADPVNDPDLIAEAQEHAWAEAYLPGTGWTSLDAAFATAQPGDIFGSPSGGQIAELPDESRHKVFVSLEVEKYSAFPIAGNNLYTINPLTATLRTVELSGEPLVFAHLVSTINQGGLAFTSVEHTYTPYFVFGTNEQLIEGDPFAELISNFPFGQDFVVGEWLDFTVMNPNGDSETFRRELFDDIGYDVRTGGGLVGDLARDSTARLSLMSSWTTMFAAYDVPAEAINDTYQEMVEMTLAGIEVREATADLQDTPNPSPEQTALAEEAARTYGLIARLAQRLHLYKFVAASDQSHDYISEAFLVKAYPDSPRLFTVGWERNDQEQTEDISFDLLHNRVRVITNPGQTEIGSEAFLFWRGLLDMAIEHEILAEVAPEPVVSVGAVFDQAIAEDIPLERITFGTLDELEALPISDQAKARITTAITDNPNKYVLVPVEMVTIPGADEPTIGWLEIDNETLEVIDTMENGQHMVAVSYSALAEFSVKAGSFIGGFSAGFFGHTMGFWIGFFGQMPLGNQDIGAVIASSKSTANEWGEKAKDACHEKADAEWCERGVAAGNAIGSAILAKADPPVQEMLFVLPLDPLETSEETAVTLSQSATLAGSVNANVSTQMIAVTGPTAHNWTAVAHNSFIFDSLNVGSADLYQNGSLVGSGAVTAVPNHTDSPTSAQTDGTAVTISGSSEGALTLYAPGLTDLGGGSQLDASSLSLNGANITLSLTNATATVNGTDYDGNLEIVTSSPVQLDGAGATAVPNFATNASFTPNAGGFMAATATGSLTVGGSNVSAANGFALGNVQDAGTLTPNGSDDSLVFNGNADFFALELSSDSSTTPADTAVNFNASIEANFSDDYTLSVHAPAGWDVSLNGSGQVTAQPPIGAAVGDYTLILTAQSDTYPDLFVSAEHLVSVTAVDDVTVAVALDPVFTVPWGPHYDVINFDDTVGHLQIPDAAFAATIQNSSSVARTFDVSVTGLPAGWAIFGGEAGNETLQLSLAAGEKVQLGLYISPTVSLPPIGTNYPFNVTATAVDDNAVTAVDNDTFTMPAIAYPAVTVSPGTQYAAANSSASFEMTLTNIGNSSGSFDLFSTLPHPDWTISNLQSPIALNPGESASQIITVTVTTGDAGIDYPIGVGAEAPTLPYEPMTAVDFYIVSAFTQPIFQAASCTVDSDALEAAIEALAIAVGELEESCNAGSCDLALRDDTVAAIRSVSTYARTASPLVTTTPPLNDIADDLETHSSNVDIENDLDALTTAVTDLGNELCQIEQHAPSARFMPYVDAILLGETADFSLDVTNDGTLATTYAITVTGLPGGDIFFNPTISPGQTSHLAINPTPVSLGSYDLAATIVPQITSINIEETAVARLNVVDKFVQVTAVLPDPAFVETGISSSTIEAEIANVSGVLQAANARTAVLDATGTELWTSDTDLNLLAGNPRLYELGTVDTSGWVEGIYTVTVNLLDESDALIPDGFGYGHLAVGQGLNASQAVMPELVPPGTVTVTNIITTVIEVNDIGLEPLGLPESSPLLNENSIPQPSAEFAQDEANASSLLSGVDPEQWRTEPITDDRLPNTDHPVFLSQPVITETAVITESLNDENLQSPTANLFTPQLTIDIDGVFTRTEQDETAVSYVGTWTNTNRDLASSGSYLYANDTGDSATATFSGSWLNLGFIGEENSGLAEIYIDGVSQGIIDLYRQDETPVSIIYDNLINTTHTFSVTVLGSANPYSNNDYVRFDYFDAWDGSTLADGTFEHDNNRVIVSTNWSTYNNATASGGSYIQDNLGSVWFPFSGDSFTYQAVPNSSLGTTRLFVDGRHLTDLHLYSPDLITRTYSFDGFGPGPHMLQLNTYRSHMTLDTLTTPGTAPFYDTDPSASYMRFEEDHPLWLYNGVAFTQTAQTWTRRDYWVGDQLSGDQGIFSDDAGDTAVITVNGEWLSLGLGMSDDGGQAEIYLDGVLDRTVNLYSHDDSAHNEFFPGLTSGNHTISVTVVGDGDVWIDYVDVWDGTALPDGTFTDYPGERVYFSGGWSAVTDVNAVDGRYWRTGTGNTWFPFTGDSVSYRAFAYSSADEARLYIDGTYIDTLDLFNSSDISRTFSIEGLGSGVHLLRVERHRGNITLEDFSTPGSAPFYTPETPTGIIRYEEDDPALLYNGLPYTQTVNSWNVNNTAVTYASEGYYAYSDTAGDTVSLTFDGTWVGVGFLTWRTYGQADVYIDGVLQETVDLFTHRDDTKSVYYGGLLDATHTISITVRGDSHENAVGTNVSIDYIDVWDGSPLPDGTFEETDRDRILYSPNWNVQTEPTASGGGYTNDGTGNNGSIWFPFTGDSVTYQAWAHRDAHEIEIKIDGVSQGFFDLYSEVPMSRTFSFDGLGAGAHMLELRSYRYDATLDAFITPGVPPFYTPPPAPTGIVRYEEDDPALLFNGYPFQQTEYCFLNCWYSVWDGNNSNAHGANTRRVNDWVELEFYGSWAGAGFATGSQGGIIELFIDGTSMGTIDTSVGQDVTSIYFGDLITGTHTISATNISGHMYFDYFDVWDGTAMGDGWFEADLEEHRGPYHFSALSSWYTDSPANLFGERLQFARDEDVLSRSTISYGTHMWFGFTGDDLLFLPFEENNKSVEVFIDGVSHGVIDLTPEYSAQPKAYYFMDLGNGPHMVHLDAVDSPLIDAFMVDPPNTLPYTPIIEWIGIEPTDVYTDTYSNSGLLSTVGIGDLQADGVVEIVVPATNGQVYVYRGDGQDTGDGDAVLWQSDLVGTGAEPTLADLDGDGQAEIIVMGSEGTAAFHADGSTYWFTDTIHSSIESAGWGGSSVGNLDLEPGAEIVLAAHNDALYVLDHDSTVLFSEPTGSLPAVPTLADVTGDGFLDIIFAQDKTITVYDAFNGFNIAWTHTHTYTGFYGQAFGAPAVVDVDGKQPGGDDGPEVVVNWGHYIDVFDADGTFLWNYYMDSDFYRRPSPITVADVDGDNEIEILTASAFNSGFLILHHKLVAVNPDGTLLWEQFMGDTSSSASGVATQDLDGDGVWEVIWNGLNEGFTILEGPTGRKIFNEEFTESGTFVDYPALGDVDGDGYAEVVTGGYNGVFVIGHDEVWGDSRPLWNQHNYHVTNINDDWSVPLQEANSWDVHNTYRTQTPERSPSPSYQVALTYTAVITNATVLTDTASRPLTDLSPDFNWEYVQDWTSPVMTTTFDSLLVDMQPGETRQISEGTLIAYQLPSGINQIMLPPLYVTAVHLGELAPAEMDVVAGGTAVFEVALTNPQDVADVFDLLVSGIPAEWLTYQTSTNVNPGETVIVTITVNVPGDVDPETLPLFIEISTGSGGQDNVTGSLTIVNGVDVSISPATQTNLPSEATAYTLDVTNHENEERTYTLTGSGLVTLDLPTDLTVAANSMETAVFTATASTPGQHPFTIEAETTSGAADSDDGVLDIVAVPLAELTLEPDPTVAGRLSTAVLTLTVTNQGSQMETYDLQVTVPAGWSYDLQDNSGAVSELTLPPTTFNSAELLLFVTPDGTAVAGDYDVTVTAVAQSSSTVAGEDTSTVEVLDQGVHVEIVSGPTTLDPRDNAIWDVQITNTGNSPDTFDLETGGIIAQAGTLSTDSVTLNAGASQTVQLAVDGLDSLLPQTFPVNVAATSQADDRIADDDTVMVELTEYEAVSVAWLPETQTVTNTLTAHFTLLITNTGNTSTIYDLATAVPGADSGLTTNQLHIPAHSTMFALVTVTAPDAGTYTLTGEADSNSSSAADSAEATLIINITNQAPDVEAGVGQTVDEGTAVTFNGSVTDPDGDNFDIEWDFDDGHTSSGSLTPNHTFGDNGVYNVSLTATDTGGLIGTDSLLITVNNVAPAVDAGPDQTSGNLVSFAGSFTDPGSLDTHTIHWDFGDGQTATGTLTPMNQYTASGQYTVTLTITDDDGGVGVDTLVVLVENQIFIPIVMKAP